MLYEHSLFIHEVNVRVLVSQSCQLFLTPWTVFCQAHLSTEFTRQEYLSGLPFPIYVYKKPLFSYIEKMYRNCFRDLTQHFPSSSYFFDLLIYLLLNLSHNYPLSFGKNPQSSYYWMNHLVAPLKIPIHIIFLEIYWFISCVCVELITGWQFGWI